MIAVVDASVAIKWFIRPDEDDGDAALEIFEDVVAGTLSLHQPPHFLAEVSAVLARLQPKDALLDVRDLLEVDFRSIDEPDIYAIGTHLAIELHQHVFDTLYHAVALSIPGATLITADRRYYNRAEGEGSIVMLKDWGAVATER